MIHTKQQLMNVLELCDDDDGNVADDNNIEDEIEDDINDDNNNNLYCSTQSYYNYHFCKLIL